MEKKVNEHTNDISFKQRVTSEKFLEVSRCSRAKHRQRNVQKIVLHVQSSFLLIRPIVLFHRSPPLPSPLSITRFYVLFEQTFNIIENFAFSSG